jgi:hypothetical protein
MELEINREDLIDDDIAREILPTSEDFTIFAAPVQSRINSLGEGDIIIYGHQRHLIHRVELHHVGTEDYKQYYCKTLPD